MNDLELKKINEERRRKGLPPLSHTDIRGALASRPASSQSTSDNSVLEFLIGYTGVPWPSPSGIMGYAVSPSHSSHSAPSSEDTTSSYDKPSSNDSSSSSTYDSGSSSSDSSSSSSGGGD